MAYRLMWASALGRMNIAVQQVRASLGQGEAPDPAVMRDPTLAPDAMLAQMQASMAVGF